MSLSDYLKCPGAASAVNAAPQIDRYPDCRSEVEIWTDEKRGKCTVCGIIISNPDLQCGDQTELNLKKFIQLAYSSGASDVKIISPDEISVEDSLTDLCNQSQCDNYGLSLSCPPHVAGPAGFRALQRKARHAVVLRIVVPAATLFSNERIEIMRLLHEVTAGIEQAAIKAGYYSSKAFAGSSCKKIFCHDQAVCRVLSEADECRYPQYARPSMSGFGINVAELMKTCGWSDDINTHYAEMYTDSISWVAGLILIG